MKLFTFLFTALTIIIIFGFSNQSFAQDPPIEYGEIPLEDLLMKSFPADTNASALILCDYGEAHIDNDLNLVFDRITRIKIFNKNGYDWATRSITINSEHERLDELEAETYFLNEDDEMDDKELDDDDIFEEKVNDNWTNYKFTLPALSPGCIVEIHYRIVSEYISYIRNWEFQHTEPVRWSEYRIRSPYGIKFSAVLRGYEPFAVNETKQVTQVFGGTAAALLGNRISRCNQYRWVVKDAPALRKEPYITTIHDYTNKVEVQLASISFPGRGSKQYLEDWTSFSKELMDHQKFGDEIDITGNVEDQTKLITDGISSPREKMKAIYNWVAKSITCTGTNRIFADKDVDDVIESKKGSDAEISFLLLSMLKSAGISCDPVILSTRDNGIIQDLYPILDQFNYVIARAKIGSEYYYLDATDPLRPMDIIPSKILGVKGLVLKNGSPNWVTFSTRQREITALVTGISLNEDGTVKGSIQIQFSGYGALIVRKDFEDEDETEKDVVKSLLKIEKSGFSIDSVKIEDKDSLEKPLNFRAWISSQDYAQSNGDMIYINPFIVGRDQDNPFKTSARKFPIDYGYKRNYTSVINIKIPKGYKLKESIESHRFVVGQNYIVYSQQANLTGDNLQILIKSDVNSFKIDPKYYSKIRELYAKIISAQSSQLVLEKAGDSETTLHSSNNNTESGKKGNK